MKPRYPSRIDTVLNRYKIGYSARHSLTGYQAHSLWSSSFSESIEQAVTDLKVARMESPSSTIGLYEINLTGDNQIHWMRLMDVSEYADLMGEEEALSNAS